MLNKKQLNVESSLLKFLPKPNHQLQKNALPLDKAEQPFENQGLLTPLEERSENEASNTWKIVLGKEAESHTSTIKLYSYKTCLGGSNKTIQNIEVSTQCTLVTSSNWQESKVLKPFETRSNPKTNSTILSQVQSNGGLNISCLLQAISNQHLRTPTCI